MAESSSEPALLSPLTAAALLFFCFEVDSAAAFDAPPPPPRCLPAEGVFSSSVSEGALAAAAAAAALDPRLVGVSLSLESVSLTNDRLAPPPALELFVFNNSWLSSVSLMTAAFLGLVACLPPLGVALGLITSSLSVSLMVVPLEDVLVTDLALEAVEEEAPFGVFLGVVFLAADSLAPLGVALGLATSSLSVSLMAVPLEDVLVTDLALEAVEEEAPFGVSLGVAFLAAVAPPRGDLLGVCSCD